MCRQGSVFLAGDECVLSTEREPDARKATLYAEKILHERSMSAQQASRLTALRQQAETLRGKEYREEIKLDSDVIPHIRGPRDQNVSRIANEYSLSKVIVDPISCTVRILGSTKESVEAARSGERPYPLSLFRMFSPVGPRKW